MSALLTIGIAANAAVASKRRQTSQILVTTELRLNGEVVSSPQLHVLEGESASLGQSSQVPLSSMNLKLMAAPSDDTKSPNSIRLKMGLDYANQGKIFKANPDIVVNPAEPMTITINSPSGDTLEMRVTATRERFDQPSTSSPSVSAPEPAGSAN